MLKELGIEVDIYVASEIDGDALRVSICIIHSIRRFNVFIYWCLIITHG